MYKRELFELRSSSWHFISHSTPPPSYTDAASYTHAYDEWQALLTPSNLTLLALA